MSPMRLPVAIVLAFAVSAAHAVRLHALARSDDDDDDVNTNLFDGGPVISTNPFVDADEQQFLPSSAGVTNVAQSIGGAMASTAGVMASVGEASADEQQMATMMANFGV